MTNRYAFAAMAIVSVFLLVSCQTVQQKLGGSSGTAPAAKAETAKESKPAAKAETDKAAKPAAAAEAPKDVKTVKGIDGWEGEISGTPAAGSKFTKLQIGMSMKQVTDLIGPPTDQGAYVTGKAWIPFYFGSDRHRYEMVYKGQGRLVFAGGSVGDYTSGHLISIIHNAKEGGYR
mgnify:CR=1 FL=1